MSKSLREGIGLLMWSSFVLLAFILSGNTSVPAQIEKILGIDFGGSNSYMFRLFLTSIAVGITTFLFAFIPNQWTLLPEKITRSKTRAELKKSIILGGLFIFETFVFATLGYFPAARSLAIILIAIAFACILMSSRVVRGTLRLE